MLEGYTVAGSRFQQRKAFRDDESRNRDRGLLVALLPIASPFVVGRNLNGLEIVSINPMY